MTWIGKKFYSVCGGLQANLFAVVELFIRERANSQGDLDIELFLILNFKFHNNNNGVGRGKLKGE